MKFLFWFHGRKIATYIYVFSTKEASFVAMHDPEINADHSLSPTRSLDPAGPCHSSITTLSLLPVYMTRLCHFSAVAPVIGVGFGAI